MATLLVHFADQTLAALRPSPLRRHPFQYFGEISRVRLEQMTSGDISNDLSAQNFIDSTHSSLTLYQVR
jgi:hypothetical protein